MMKGVFKIKDRLISLIKSRDWKSLKARIEKLDAVEMVESLKRFDEKGRLMPFQLLDNQKTEDVFKKAPHRKQQEILEGFANNSSRITKYGVTRLLNNIGSDDLTAFIEELPEKADQQATNKSNFKQVTKVFLRTLIITILLFCFRIGVGNQVKAQTQITLQDALNYALNNSKILRQARLDIENAVQVVRENRANAYPQIGINSSLTGNPIVQRLVIPAEAFGGEAGKFTSLKVGQNWGALSQITLSQLLYNQQVFSGMKLAKNSVQFYELAKKVSEENVVQQVAASFYQVLISAEKIEVIDAHLAQMEVLEEIIKGQFEAGLAKKMDWDRIKVNKGNLKTQKLSMQNVVSQQKKLLKYYMGMSVSEDIELEVGNEDQVNLSIFGNHEDSVSISNLYSYKLLNKQEELLSLQEEAHKAAGLPTLSLDANYTYNTLSNQFNLYSNKALNYDASAVILTLKISLFDGFARKSKIKQTKIAKERLKEDKRKTSNELQMYLENARMQMEISLEDIQNQRDNVDLAQEVFSSTENNYRNGLAPLTDFLDAETDLITSQNSLHEALLNYKIAELDYLKSQGNIKSLLAP